MNYFDELKTAMTWLGKKSNTCFLGQSVSQKGTAMFNTLSDVSLEKRLELPVCEDMQMGMSIGMAMAGTIPISIFPRWNFFLLATNQLVNHLDKIPMMADVPYKPNVIIRVGIGSERPLHPQHQHIGNYSEAFTLMCSNIEVIQLHEPYQIMDAYEKAYTRTDGKSTILAEFGDYYNEK